MPNSLTRRASLSLVAAAAVHAAQELDPKFPTTWSLTPLEGEALKNRRIGPRSHRMTPQLSWCLRCKTTWRFVQAHVTYYEPGNGIAPLCKLCWEELATPKARLPFYHQMWMEWGSESNLKEWQGIMDAVMKKGL
jgi:hypothetical protein